MTSVERYVKKSRQELKVRPALPFGVAFDVGVIGVVQDDQFVRYGTAMSILGVDVGPVVSQQGDANWQIQSGRDVGINVLLEGQAAKAFPQVPSIGARIEVSFKKSDSFLAVAKSPLTSTLSDPHTLIGAIADAFRRGIWARNYVLIYEVVSVDSILVLLSKEDDTSVLLNADANIAPGGQKIADLAGNLSVTHQSKELIRFDSSKRINVFYNAYRVRVGWLTGRVNVEAFSLSAPPDVYIQA